MRGRRPHRAHRPPARRGRADRRRPTSTRCTTATRTSTASDDAPTGDTDDRHRTRHEVWFLTGSQGCTARTTLGQVADQSQRDRRGARTTPATLPVPVVWKPVLTDADAIRRIVLGGQRRRRLRRRDRLDAHLLAGQDVDRRAGRAAQAAAAPAHPGQRRAAVGRDRHGLHEPQPGRPRRPRVRLHPDPPRRRPQDRRRARHRPGASRRGSARWARAALRLRRGCARCGWPASATTCATSPSPRATRSRPSCGSASRSTPTASTIWSPSSTPSPTPTSTTWSPSTSDRYDVAPELRAGGEPARLAALRRAASRPGCARSSTDGGFGAFTTNFEDLGGLRQLPGLAVQRLMADGYGFGGEGDWKTSALLRTRQGDGGRPARRHLVHGGLHLPPRARRAERSSARTCSRSARRSPPDARAARSTRSASAAARTRSGWSSTPRPGPAIVARHRRPRRPLPAGRQRDRGRRARRAAAASCRSPAPSGPAPTLTTRPSAG